VADESRPYPGLDGLPRLQHWQGDPRAGQFHLAHLLVVGYRRRRL